MFVIWLIIQKTFCSLNFVEGAGYERGRGGGGRGYGRGRGRMGGRTRVGGNQAEQ